MHKKDLDKYYSSKKLGSFVEDDKTIFRIFAPRAERVMLFIYKKAESSQGKKYKMIKDDDGVWEAEFDEELYGLFYSFLIRHKNSDEDVICLDPYAKAVATLNNYLNPRKAIVVNEDDFDWENDEWIQMDWHDLIIYEMHVRDMTAHKTSGAKNPGTYKGLTENGINGGIDYIKSLGVNAVELLPVQEFANVEIPFNKTFLGKNNTWNIYERNHWGYMTAAFFAPDSYYSSEGNNLRFNKWAGKSGKQVNEFKEMVKAFHKNNIAIIMDVVYNHYSEYELGGLKEIDKEYYFRIDVKDNLTSYSYTGNDLKTERPMVRRMIIDSVLYWMKYYHVDGFRFDLGHLIDWCTVEEIIEEAQKINPDVIILCEPWGNGYDPAGFSLRGWGSWNDQVRNSVKGENPFTGKGWIFGKWYGDNDINSIKNYINGTLIHYKNGLFQRKEHSVNYLESHDGYTLGDFIRLAVGGVEKDEVITNVDENAILSELQLKLNKLAALFLFTCQGIIMIHEGQEFARSKVIFSDIKINDPGKGTLDHNSYEKDNETNYINYDHSEINNELVEYYKGLIELRLHNDVFKKAERECISFNNISDDPFVISFSIKHKMEEFFIVMNANQTESLVVNLPDGMWSILVDGNKSFYKNQEDVTGEIKIPAVAGSILKKIRIII